MFETAFLYLSAFLGAKDHKSLQEELVQHISSFELVLLGVHNSVKGTVFGALR